jgi:predicted Zn-dependent peptidase
VKELTGLKEFERAVYKPDRASFVVMGDNDCENCTTANWLI